MRYGEKMDMLDHISEHDETIPARTEGEIGVGIKTEDLRAFAAVVRHRSVSRAAEAPDQLEAGGDVAPLVGAAHLQFNAHPPVEMGEVDRGSRVGTGFVGALGHRSSGRRSRHAQPPHGGGKLVVSLGAPPVRTERPAGRAAAILAPDHRAPPRSCDSWHDGAATARPAYLSDPPSPCVTAFVSRLESTCDRRSGSASTVIGSGGRVTVR